MTSELDSVWILHPTEATKEGTYIALYYLYLFNISVCWYTSGEARPEQVWGRLKVNVKKNSPQNKQEDKRQAGRQCPVQVLK